VFNLRLEKHVNGMS